MSQCTVFSFLKNERLYRTFRIENILLLCHYHDAEFGTTVIYLRLG